MRENYLLFRANRYDIKGKAYLQAMEKYYLGDPGSGSGSLAKPPGTSDIGSRTWCISNCCDAIEPCISARSVPRKSTYTPDPESDHYYQVSLTVMDEKTLARELHPLQSIDDNHPKTLLTMDRIG